MAVVGFTQQCRLLRPLWSHREGEGDVEDGVIHHARAEVLEGEGVLRDSGAHEGLQGSQSDNPGGDRGGCIDPKRGQVA